MCLFGSSNKPAPTAPAAAKAPPSLDLSGQTTADARKLRSKGKRGLRNKSTTGLNIGGSNSANLSIPSGSSGGS